MPGTPGGDIIMRQVGRYQVTERLGRGGMATVYRAHDPGIGRDVAIKFLHDSLCEDEDCRARFLRESRAAGGLSHPNIVIVHDVGEIEGRPYMAMELLQGDMLSDVMQAGHALPVRDVVVMGIQLARALDYAHAHGIVHRDIKPGNIVRLEGTDTIKVTDFGIAHMEAMGSGEQRTRVGDVLGTPQYMSPEQTQGTRLDGRSDLFSVGIVLYQMLSGQRPFQGDSLVSIAMKIANEEPTPLEQLRPEVPASLAPHRRALPGQEARAALRHRARPVRGAGTRAGRARRGGARARQAAHHPAAREVGRDDGARGDGRDGRSPPPSSRSASPPRCSSRSRATAPRWRASWPRSTPSPRSPRSGRWSRSGCRR